MAACKSGRNLLSWVCVLLISSGSVESLNWIAQPLNPVEATEGQEVSLTWNYTLTAGEQTASETFFKVTWRKFNPGTSSFAEFASYVKFTASNPTFSEPNAPRIVVDRSISNTSASLQFKDIRLEDEGIYKIEVSVTFPGTAAIAEQESNLTVVVSPGIANVSKDQVICEGSLVTLSCNATGKPTPTITWTKVEDNGTDSAPLFPVVEGKHLLSNIQRSANGTYRCTADNGVGVPVNRTVSVEVEYSPAVERIVNSLNSVNEGQSFNMTCLTSEPEPNVYWIKENNGARINGSVLTFTNINRNDSGQYRCEAKNDCGNDSSVQSIEVFYKPDNVELLTNTSEDSYCSDLWVNFTCKASNANPAVSNYVLYEHNNSVAFNNNGTWILKLSEGKQHVYHCVAEQFVENVTSTNVTITVNVSASVTRVNTTIFTEGEDVILLCDVSGIPPPDVSWFNDKNENVYNGSLWKLPSVNRSYNGTYKCEASNDCGKDNKRFDVIVQYEPDDVRLRPNITNSTICAEYTVNFTCSADANPAVDSYTLFKNGSVVNTSSLGVWSITINTAGQFVYRCEANNSVGSGKSSDVTFNVEVPAKVINVNTTIFTEGEDAILFCDVSGVPPPVVSWFNDKNENVYNGSLWKLLSINRSYNGTYQCIASNACRMDRKTFDIIVQHKPEGVRLSPNITLPVCAGYIVNFTCSANANPAVDNYTLFENGSAVNTSSLGVWSITMNTAGRFVYRCEANNSVGFNKSTDVIVNVEVSASVISVNTTDFVEGKNVILFCNVSGVPDPSVSWINVTSMETVNDGAIWRLPNISRNNNGMYKCRANNTCNEDNKMVNIVVQYPPTKGPYSAIVRVIEGTQVTLSCPVDGRPDPNITWYKGNDTAAEAQHQGREWTFQAASNDAGWYSCSAKNFLDLFKPVNVSFHLIVEKETTTASPTNRSQTTASPRNPPQKETTTASPTNRSHGPPWPIIGGIIGAVVVVIIVILLVAWWVHNKRKCRRKDTKIHNSESEVLHGQNDIEDGAYARVNGGYADAGPPSANGTSKFVQQAAAAPPAYAVVDKSKKKKKKAEGEDPYAEVEDPKKDKKTADPSTHDYAVVNKSKKKKKEEDENAYATVDKSKKSKKGQQKPKAPGEVLYADLGDFQPVQPLPTVSTSPEPLAPLKRPPSYQGTEYADITQFLKGNATLPEGQSTEMQPTYANAGGGQEAANKENANTGGEGDIEPKETPM